MVDVGSAGGGGDGPAPAPRWARGVAVALLGTLLVAFVVPIRFDLWPVTSWELFSRPRSAEQATYRVEVVAADGTATALPFARLGPGHRRWLTLARTFPAAEPEERQEVCRSWADAAAEALGPERVREVRVHRLVRRAAARAQDPPVTVSRTEVVRCSPS